MGNNKEIQRQQYNRTVAMLKQYRDAQFFIQHTTDEESRQRTAAAVQHITAALKEIQRRRQQAEREEEYTALCMGTKGNRECKRIHNDFMLLKGKQYIYKRWFKFRLQYVWQRLDTGQCRPAEL